MNARTLAAYSAGSAFSCSLGRYTGSCSHTGKPSAKLYRMIQALCHLRLSKQHLPDTSAADVIG